MSITASPTKSASMKFKSIIKERPPENGRFEKLGHSKSAGILKGDIDNPVYVIPIFDIDMI